MGEEKLRGKGKGQEWVMGGREKGLGKEGSFGGEGCCEEEGRGSSETIWSVSILYVMHFGQLGQDNIGSLEA
ncbi:hypothetical protein ACH5RR_009107 [Cinchona calisaya]|uniref:Uncharacterized protein n=1 Tax=Cinchona calisaya TaxID=153742 RepID=A0ABD3AH26_9GENT